MQRIPRAWWLSLALFSACQPVPSAPPPASLHLRTTTLGLTLVELPPLDPSTPAIQLATTELPQSAFAAFVAATHHVTNAELQGGAKIWAGTGWRMDPTAHWRTVFPGASHPVVAVSWHDAVAFCDWLTAHAQALGELPEGLVYRLPTETEWEHAARAGTHHVYAGTDVDTEVCRYANVPDRFAAAEGLGRAVLPCDDGVGLGTAEVGRYEPNAWGLHDMTGNVWEWTSSSPLGDASQRVMRGGSWSGRLDGLRIDGRDAYPPELRGGAIGLRVALAPP